MIVPWLLPSTNGSVSKSFARRRIMRQSRWSTLAVLALAQFMVVLDLTIVNVALPHIQTDLGFSSKAGQWVISAYTLVFGCILLLGGRAGDLPRRRRVFNTGL